MEKNTISHTKTRKLSKVASGQSYSVTLPIEFVRHLKWRERQKLDITLEGDTLIIKDWEMKKRV
jgi:virulence-associated protein VagC